VPVPTIPGWLQAFAASQPVTAPVDALGALCLGGPTTRPCSKPSPGSPHYSPWPCPWPSPATAAPPPRRAGHES
jgi:hypothetical protein